MVGRSHEGEFVFSSRVSQDWNIGDNPNGGFLVSIALRALAEVVEHPHPLSVTTHFLRPGVPEETCEIYVRLIRHGRTLSTASAQLIQQGKPRIEVIAAFGDLSRSVGTTETLSIEKPDLPDPETCVPRTGSTQGIELPLTQSLDVRLHPAQVVPGSFPRAEVSGWIRFADGREPDAHALQLFVDAFPPSAASLLGKVGWVPTLELTTHVRALPSAGWIGGRFVTSDLAGGRMIESGALWDSNGTLVAQSRQLGMVMGDT